MFKLEVLKEKQNDGCVTVTFLPLTTTPHCTTHPNHPNTLMLTLDLLGPSTPSQWQHATPSDCSCCVKDSEADRQQMMVDVFKGPGTINKVRTSSCYLFHVNVWIYRVMA